MNERIIGLDIGIASVGWAVVENGKRIIDLGVRTFDKAETAKKNKVYTIQDVSACFIMYRIV